MWNGLEIHGFPISLPFLCFEGCLAGDPMIPLAKDVDNCQLWKIFGLGLSGSSTRSLTKSIHSPHHRETNKYNIKLFNKENVLYVDVFAKVGILCFKILFYSAYVCISWHIMIYNYILYNYIRLWPMPSNRCSDMLGLDTSAGRQLRQIYGPGRSQPVPLDRNPPFVHSVGALFNILLDHTWNEKADMLCSCM